MFRQSHFLLRYMQCIKNRFNDDDLMLFCHCLVCYECFSEHGTCSCGRCICEGGWFGKLCQHARKCNVTEEESKSQCESSDGILCSGKGKCLLCTKDPSVIEPSVKCFFGKQNVRQHFISKPLLLASTLHLPFSNGGSVVACTKSPTQSVTKGSNIIDFI